ncbi:uncharacterized protein SPSK_05669 [Sporothrix schenckii 1099-18]|uniref:Uncharacterized protein n=1 Tax=Sporothrix schenckii 1099-18 TaxID=1397361 RepID=A0A0F2LUM9_SPOSC|nr:uncharacterized protein SPSK_05669 [Sporothrix schenckii 1099-18]KJR80215.1 hypothetical protein SPSK_05669 [Sporothrix schenckii 1099-18]
MAGRLQAPVSLVDFGLLEATPPANPTKPHRAVLFFSFCISRLRRARHDRSVMSKPSEDPLAALAEVRRRLETRKKGRDRQKRKRGKRKRQRGRRNKLQDMSVSLALPPKRRHNKMLRISKKHFGERRQNTRRRLQ